MAEVCRGSSNEAAAAQERVTDCCNSITTGDSHSLRSGNHRAQPVLDIASTQQEQENGCSSDTENYFNSGTVTVIVQCFFPVFRGLNL